MKIIKLMLEETESPQEWPRWLYKEVSYRLEEIPLYLRLYTLQTQLIYYQFIVELQKWFWGIK
jgi:hypothetical protein